MATTSALDYVEELNRVLSDVQLLYQKLRGYHWNVAGPEFFKLHDKFEELYTFAADQADELAERIRGIGGKPAATYERQISLSSLEEDPDINEAHDMVRNILDDIDVLQNDIQTAHSQAEEHSDMTTTNLLEDIHDNLESHRWMLEAFLS